MTKQELLNYCKSFVNETMEKRIKLDKSIQTVDYIHHLTICENIIYYHKQINRMKRDIKKENYRCVEQYDYLNNTIQKNKILLHREENKLKLILKNKKGDN